MELVLIAAVAENGVIGLDGGMPWRKDKRFKDFCKADMEHFVTNTTPHPIVVGRGTYESIPVRYRPFEGRLTYVLSREAHYKDPKQPNADIHHVSSLRDALWNIHRGFPQREEINYNTAWIAGGPAVYEEAMNDARRMLITHIHGTFKGDAYFPEFTENEWTETNRVPGPRCHWSTWERR